MPDKPLWLDRLPEALRQLENGTEPWIDRPALESLLGVGRRRAQQLLAPIAIRRVGTSVVASRADLMGHLKRIAAGEEAYYPRPDRRAIADQLHPPLWKDEVTWELWQTLDRRYLLWSDPLPSPNQPLLSQEL
jgi:hypothetical protein